MASIKYDRIGIPSGQDDPIFHLENGLRVVSPYCHKHRVFAKKRWLGKTILQMFSSEFNSLSEEYYRTALESHLIKVNNNPVSIDYKIQESDLIEHLMHRHEPPVQSTPIRVIFVDDNIVVVDKPPSLSAHPCGGFTHNTVQRILAYEQPREIGYGSDGMGFLHPIHRLDRLVSGILILAKNKATARQLSNEFQSGVVEKLYIALVVGLFPISALAASEVLCCSHSEPCAIDIDSSFVKEANDIGHSFIVSCPLKLDEKRLDGVHTCSCEGKDARTIFRLIATDGVNSLVHCRPVTGRTHQIRLHLQRLGFPILNDPLYGLHPHSLLREIPVPNRNSFDEQDRAVYKKPKTGNFGNDTSSTREEKSEIEKLTSLCVYCQEGERAAFSKEQLRREGVCLHAYSYQSPRWTFRTEYPPWANRLLNDQPE